MLPDALLPFLRHAWVIPTSSGQYPSFSTVLQPSYSSFGHLTSLGSFCSPFCVLFSCPEDTWLSDLRICQWIPGGAVLPPQAPCCSTWQDTLSAWGCWPGGKPSPFCLGDDVSASSCIPHSSELWQIGLVVRTALSFGFKGLLCGDAEWGLYLTPPWWGHLPFM